jgi:predicted phosphate transport protein (TIGR00153 family)
MRISAAGAVKRPAEHQMRFRLTPRQTSFFDLFAASADNLQEAAQLLTALPGVSPGERDAIAEQMREMEHHADEVTHDILRRLNSTFVTPFDREDIYSLASGLDDCMDYMEEAADLIMLYKLDGLPAGVERQVEILHEQAVLTAAAMRALESMKHLEEFWMEINRLENSADRVYRAMLAELFDSVTDAVELLKIKEVIDALESAADAFEKVANHVETIAVKES